MFSREENLVLETGELAKAVERDAFLKFYWIWGMSVGHGTRPIRQAVAKRLLLKTRDGGGVIGGWRGGLSERTPIMCDGKDVISWVPS